MTDDSTGKDAPEGKVDAVTAQLKNRKAVQAEIDAIYQRDRLGMHVLEDYTYNFHPFNCNDAIDIQEEINSRSHDEIRAHLTSGEGNIIHSATILPYGVKVRPYDYWHPIGHHGAKNTHNLMYLVDFSQNNLDSSPYIIFVHAQAIHSGQNSDRKRILAYIDGSTATDLLPEAIEEAAKDKDRKLSNEKLDFVCEEVKKGSLFPIDDTKEWENSNIGLIRDVNEVMLPMHTDHIKAIAFPQLGRGDNGANLAQEALSTLAACACYFKHREFDKTSNLPIATYDMDQPTDKMITVLAVGEAEVKNLALRAANLLQLLAKGTDDPNDPALEGIDMAMKPAFLQGGNLKIIQLGVTKDNFIKHYQHYCDYITSLAELNFPKLTEEDIIITPQVTLFKDDITKDPLPSRLLTDPDRVRGVAQDSKKRQ